MKKRSFLLFAFLLTILSVKTVSAQDIIIAGNSYPLIILIPFVIVVGAWALIILIWLKKNLSKVSLLLYNLGHILAKFGTVIGFGRIAEKLEELKKRKQEEEERRRRALLSKEEPEEAKKKEKKKKDLTPFLDKLDTIENQLPKFKEDVVFKNLAEVIKSFFAALLNLQHEFTEKELQEILEKKKKGLVEFTQKLAELKYSGKPLTKQELREIVDEFKHIVHHYVKVGWKKKHVTKTPMEKIVAQDKRILGNIKAYLDFLKQESRKTQIEAMLDDERQVLSKNIRSIKKRYNKMLKLYVQLSPREKAIVYPKLVGFYDNINKAIFSTVYSKKSKEQLEYFAEKLKKLKSMPKKESMGLKIKKAFVSKEKPVKIPIKGKKLKVKIKPSVMPKEPFFKRLFSGKEVEIKPKKVKIIKKKKAVAIKPKKIAVKHSFGYKFKRLFAREEISVEKIRKTVKLPEEPVAIKPQKPIPSMQPLFKRLIHIFQREEIPTKPLKIPPEKLEEKPRERIEPVKKVKLLKPPKMPKPSKLKSSVRKEPEIEVEKLPEEEKEVIQELDKLITKPEIERVDYIAKIKDLIVSGKAHLKIKDLPAAENTYQEVRVNYANLSKQEQNKIYPRILKFFNIVEAARQKIIDKQLEKQQKLNEKKQLEGAKREEIEVEEILEREEVVTQLDKLKSEQEKLKEQMEMIDMPSPPGIAGRKRMRARKLTKREMERIKKAALETKQQERDEARRKREADKARKKLAKEEDKITKELEKLKRGL